MQDELPLRKEDEELGLKVIEARDVDECLDETLFVLAILEIDEVVLWSSLL